MVTLMQNEVKTDKWKTMITFSSDNFSAPSESLEYVKVNNFEYTYIMERQLWRSTAANRR